MNKFEHKLEVVAGNDIDKDVEISCEFNFLYIFIHELYLDDMMVFIIKKLRQKGDMYQESWTHVMN